MKRNIPSKVLVFFILTYIPLSAVTQTVGEVLTVEKRKIIRERDRLLLKFNGRGMEFDLTKGNNTNFLPLRDSSLFLSRPSSINVFRRPMNPLNFLSEASYQFIPDPIIEEYRTAMESIVKSLTDFTTQVKSEKTAAKEKAIAAQLKGKKKTAAPTVYESCNEIDALIQSMEAIQAELKKDQKNEINNIFKGLKKMSFEKENETKGKIEESLIKIESIQDHFSTAKEMIEKMENDIASYKCPEPHPFLVKYAFHDLLSKVKLVLEGQTVRYNNLKKAFSQVDEAYKAAVSNEEGPKWIVAQQVKINDNLDDNNIDVRRDEISKITITIYDAGLTLSDDEEIIAQPQKEKSTTTIKIRRFQRFIPEVVPGFAYTFLEYPKFEVGTDASGNSVVADVGNENFKRINFNVMINFNYFVPMSSINPFLQIGVGANAEYPSFFSGAGLRFDLHSKTFKGLAVSGGIVSSWTKTLQTLEIGSPVTDKAQLESDIHFEFNWPPKPYISFQLKF